MNCTLEYLIWEQRCYVDKFGRLFVQSEEDYKPALSVIQDGKILIFV